MEPEIIINLTRKIKMVTKQGIIKDLAYLLYNPEYFEKLKFALRGVIAIEWDAINQIEFFKFKGVRIGKHSQIKGAMGMPMICKTKQH